MGNGHSVWEVRREMWGTGVMEMRTDRNHQMVVRAKEVG